MINYTKPKETKEIPGTNMETGIKHKKKIYIYMKATLNLGGKSNHKIHL